MRRLLVPPQIQRYLNITSLERFSFADRELQHRGFNPILCIGLLPGRRLDLSRKFDGYMLWALRSRNECRRPLRLAHHAAQFAGGR